MAERRRTQADGGGAEGCESRVLNAQKEAEKIRQNAEIKARNTARKAEQLRLQLQLVNSDEFRQFLSSKGTGQGGNLPFFRPPIFPVNGAPSFGSMQFQN
jgi:hypothetical protein